MNIARASCLLTFTLALPLALGCSSDGSAGSGPGQAGAAASGGAAGNTASAGRSSTTGGGSAGTVASGGSGTSGAPQTAGTSGASGGSSGAGASAGSSGAGASASSGGSGATAGHGGSSAGGTPGSGGATAGSSGMPPHVTPQNATSVPAMYGNPVTNPGKLTTHVTYPVYYYSANVSSPLPPPTIQKLGTPMMKSCNVYTPPGYDKGTQYPLIIVMHGITDSPDTWVERSNPKIATLFDNLITSKVTKPFVAVFASGTINNSTDGYYSFGAELVNDLLPFIEANYSVLKDRGSRAMAGFSFGGMQTLSTGLCTNLKSFAWFAGLDPAGPGTPSANDIAKYVEMQNPEMYPLYYLYIGVGKNDGTSMGSASAAANGLASKGKYITSANFSYQNDIVGQDGGHNYPTAETVLYNFLRMAFATTN